ncbi:MAG: YybS family protein [Tepidanaerobacteraceae bacterium]|nr:YybS family protein [Tepidanaerobacteraceae bacterium]
MRSNNTKSMVEGALLAAINIILSIIAIYMPILGTFATLIWPVPIVILGIRHGLKTSILSIVVAGIFVAILSGPFQAVTIVVSFGLMGIVMGRALKKNFSPFKVLGVGSVASLVSKVALVFLTMIMMGINPLTEEITVLKESLSLAGSFYQKMGMDPQTVETTIESFTRSLDLLPLIIPGIFIMASVLDSFLTYVVTKAVLGRMGQKLEDFTPFWLWRFPDYTVAFFLLGNLLTLLETYWPVGVLKSVGLNLALVFGFTFLVQGFSLLAFYLGKYNVGKPFRLLIVFFVLFNPLFLQILFFAGLFDILFNFRKI